MQQSLPHVDGVEHRFLNLKGLNFHVAEAGTGQPLVMLHGWPQHWFMWRHQIPQLARRYRVICPDLRGFGWSDAPAQGYEKEQLADDIMAVLDALKLENIGLVGHDWGGWVGFLLCLRQPQRIRRYLALNITHPFQKLDSRVITLWRFWYQWVIASPILGVWILRKRPGFVRRLLQGGVVHKTWSEDEIAAYTTHLTEPARAYASVLLYRTFLLREFLSVIRGRYLSMHLSVPTLILFGVRDFAISTRLLHGYAPYADDLKVEFVPNCGHFIAEERPRLVTRRILQLFGKDSV